MPRQHATPVCHVSMTRHHDTSACHVSMPRHHVTLACPVSMHRVLSYYDSDTYYLLDDDCCDDNEEFTLEALQHVTNANEKWLLEDALLQYCPKSSRYMRVTTMEWLLRCSTWRYTAQQGLRSRVCAMRCSASSRASGGGAGKLLKCSLCMGVRYCSVECHTRHWRLHHKEACTTSQQDGAE